MKPYVCKRHGQQDNPQVWFNEKTGFTHRWCRVCTRERYGNRGEYMSEWRAKRREHRVAYMAKWRKDNAEGLKTLRQEKRTALVGRVMAAYGGACACCGETEPVFLTIDHINNDGNIERNAASSIDLYARIEKMGYPKDRYRVLCANCNFGRQRVRGKLICPHVVEGA
jgi:hypothetical protein